MNEEIKQKESDGVVSGRVEVKTRDAKWLCLEDIYQKFHRPNTYDIGSTNIENVKDFSFVYITKSVTNLFLLELLIHSHQEESFTVAVSGSSELTFDKRSDKVYLDTFLKRYHIKNKQNISFNYITTYSFSNLDVELLKNKKLFITIELKHTKHTDLNMNFIDDIKCHLSDFGAVLKDPIGADFTIESCEGEKFHVHKVILGAQSEVFMAMLREDTAESQNSYVKLVDVCKDDLKCILEFIYTGSVEELESKNCYNLLMLADRYNLNGLKVLTQHALNYQLTDDNALEILVLADMYNADFLKISALKFIKTYKNVLGNSMFDEINNSDLVRELCRFIAL